MGPGDAVYFDARLPHGGRACGARSAVVLSVAANTEVSSEAERLPEA